MQFTFLFSNLYVSFFENIIPNFNLEMMDFLFQAHLDQVIFNQFVQYHSKRLQKIIPNWLYWQWRT